MKTLRLYFFLCSFMETFRCYFHSLARVSSIIWRYKAWIHKLLHTNMLNGSDCCSLEWMSDPNNANRPSQQCMLYAKQEKIACHVRRIISRLTQYMMVLIQFIHRWNHIGCVCFFYCLHNRLLAFSLIIAGLPRIELLMLLGHGAGY